MWKYNIPNAFLRKSHLSHLKLKIRVRGIIYFYFFNGSSSHSQGTSASYWIPWNDQKTSVVGFSHNISKMFRVQWKHQPVCDSALIFAVSFSWVPVSVITAFKWLVFLHISTDLDLNAPISTIFHCCQHQFFQDVKSAQRAYISQCMVFQDFLIMQPGKKTKKENYSFRLGPIVSDRDILTMFKLFNLSAIMQ